MDKIDILKKREADLSNILKCSNDRMKSLMKEQIELAQKITEEKQNNDKLVSLITEIRVRIEVFDELKKD